MLYFIYNIISSTRPSAVFGIVVWDMAAPFQRLTCLMHMVYLWWINIHTAILTTRRISSRGVSLSKSSQPSW